MPPAVFFRSLGLYVHENFFDQPACRDICARIAAAECEKATIEKETGKLLDEKVRKVLVADVEKSLSSRVSDALERLKPALEAHFDLPLARADCPVFLRYGEGAFYAPHLDSSSLTSIRDRRISLVIFLNGQSSQPAPGCYAGGSLTFYGLLQGAAWEKCPLALEPEPGLLLAFRSETLHEVTAVTFGQRFTIASWFRC